ncbi:MAG: hypothetical protein IKN26_03485 [Eubacterium sp.]|nr:hypothetical protein [Eubacterium sp.]MBR4241637.1 hypothetical protein [Eubacterium sp.]MBR7061006.1 hypothetical protein [Eubacterium sp.]
MDNINEIISSLSNEDIEMLKGVASSILGEKNEVEKKENLPVQNSNQTSIPGLNSSDFQMMMRAKTIFEKMNSASSKNADLINALKPHLSPESRKKADNAIRILKLFDILPYLKDLF